MTNCPDHHDDAISITRRQCARCLAAKADELINNVLVRKIATKAAMENTEGLPDLCIWIDPAINLPPVGRDKFPALPKGIISNVEYIGSGKYAVKFSPQE